jgi:hypothetical protein
MRNPEGMSELSTAMSRFESAAPGRLGVFASWLSVNSSCGWEPEASDRVTLRPWDD